MLSGGGTLVGFATYGATASSFKERNKQRKLKNKCLKSYGNVKRCFENRVILPVFDAPYLVHTTHPTKICVLLFIWTTCNEII